MLRAEEIRAGLESVEARIAAACQRAGRPRAGVTLVAVTKTFPSDAVDAVIAAGARHVGENRVQEARDKKPAVSGLSQWHLIGHLQSNKVKDAVRLFDVIHTVDTIGLAEKIARSAETSGKVQDVLIEVNIGREEQKEGADPDDVITLARGCSSLPGIRLRGVMAIPPIGPAQEMRTYFRELRKLRDEAGLVDLSMGMTDDFEVAIEEGSTIIRVGRAIFGSRG
jgi:PLP dependent protein